MIHISLVHTSGDGNYVELKVIVPAGVLKLRKTATFMMYAVHLHLRSQEKMWLWHFSSRPTTGYWTARQLTTSQVISQICLSISHILETMKYS